MKIFDFNIERGSVNWGALAHQASEALAGFVAINERHDGAQVRFLLEPNSPVEAKDCEAVLMAHKASDLSPAEIKAQKIAAARDVLAAVDTSGGAVALTAEQVAALVTLVRGG